MDYDQVFDRYIGGCSKSHVKFAIYVFTSALVTTVVITEGYFQVSTPQYQCSDLDDLYNETTGQIPAWTGQIPAWTDQCKVPIISDHHSMLTLITNNDTLDEDRYNFTSCTSWRFSGDLGNTVVTQWSLVCGRDWIPRTIQSTVMAGLMLGVLVGGILSDRYGRKPVSAVSLVLVILLRFLMAFSPNYTCFMVSKFFSGAASLSFYTPNFINYVENIGISRRLVLSIAVQCSFGLCYAIMGVVAYFVRDWVHLTLVYSASLLPLLCFFILVKESPRWLIAQGRQDEAMTILHQWAKTNKKRLPENLVIAAKSEDMSHRYQIYHLCSGPRIFIYTIITIYIWMVNVLVYYGLTFNEVSFSGSVYWNFALMGVVESLCIPLALPISQSRLGRRWGECLALFISGASVIIAHFIPAHVGWLQVAFFLIGKAFIATAFAMLYIYTPEIFPTSLRNGTVGLASQLGRIGGIIAPFIGKLAIVWSPLPELVIGGAAILASLITPILPETRNKPLPLTIDDTYRLSKRRHVPVTCDL